MVFNRTVIQFAFVSASIERSNIYGHTVRLIITLYLAAFRIGRLSGPNQVAGKSFVFYWLVEPDSATFIRNCEKTNKIYTVFALFSPWCYGEMGREWEAGVGIDVYKNETKSKSSARLEYLTSRLRLSRNGKR